MGFTRKKICSYVGCKNFALPNSAYCQAHQKTVLRRTTSKYENYYRTNWWKKERKQFLIEHIWCEKCLEEGKHTLSNTVHHSCGFNSWETFCDKSKWLAWCDSCHSSYHTHITNEELYEKNKDKWGD